MLKATCELNLNEALQWFGQLTATLDGTARDGIVDKALEATAKNAITMQGNSFSQRARGRKFEPLSDVTVLLRAASKTGGKILGDKASIDSKRARTVPMIDTSALVQSLSGKSHADAVSKKDGKGVWFAGTKRKGADVHQAGGRGQPFNAADALKRLDQNVIKTVPGRRKKKIVNPNYSRWRFIFEKRMDGKTYNVPKREIIAPFPPAMVERLTNIFKGMLLRGLQKFKP